MSTCQLHKSPRDGRLDFLRGLCLVNMVIVHLIEQGLRVPAAMDEWLAHWLRFAAGGFIMTSGLCIGAIHYHKALDSARRWKTHLSLVRRAGLVLLAHYCATFLSLVFVPLHGYRTYDTLDYVRDVLYFWTGYDLLLFYVVMLLAGPLLIEWTRRAGGVSVALASTALFFTWYDHPYLPLYAIQDHFPVIRWQAVFVFGFLMGTKLRAYDALPPTAKLRLLAAALLAWVLIAGWSASQCHAGFAPPWWLTVTKYPLSPLEVARYLALCVAIGVSIDLAWPRLGSARLSPAIQVMGVQSLLLWVLHDPIIKQMVRLDWRLGIGLSLLAAWGIARFATWLDRQCPISLPALPRLAYTAPLLGSLASILLLFHLQQPPLAPSPLPNAVNLVEKVGDEQGPPASPETAELIGEQDMVL